MVFALVATFKRIDLYVDDPEDNFTPQVIESYINDNPKDRTIYYITIFVRIWDILEFAFDVTWHDFVTYSVNVVRNDHKAFNSCEE